MNVLSSEFYESVLDESDGVWFPNWSRLMTLCALLSVMGGMGSDRKNSASSCR